ncbi:hypothetical protein DFJ77DRAFT_514719 [Powellomyces hirtus]|nr:hypothetical protein DFJ77DRAFT_514719 [Powellomyces hirtus]
MQHAAAQRILKWWKQSDLHLDLPNPEDIIDMATDDALARWIDNWALPSCPHKRRMLMANILRPVCKNMARLLHLIALILAVAGAGYAAAKLRSSGHVPTTAPLLTTTAAMTPPLMRTNPPPTPSPSRVSTNPPLTAPPLPMATIPTETLAPQVTQVATPRPTIWATAAPRPLTSIIPPSAHSSVMTISMPPISRKDFTATVPIGNAVRRLEDASNFYAAYSLLQRFQTSTDIDSTCSNTYSVVVNWLAPQL